MKILREDGLTLLETLVAIAIFGILLGGLLTLMQSQNAVIRDSAEVLSARLKVNETMELLKVRPFKELQSSSALVVSELRNKTIDVLVSDFDATKALKKIVVTISWFDQRGREQQYTLSTLRSQYSQTPVNMP